MNDFESLNYSSEIDLPTKPQRGFPIRVSPPFGGQAKATPFGRGQSSTAMPVERRTTHLVLQVVLSPQHATRSEPNESFARAITHDLAL